MSKSNLKPEDIFFGLQKSIGTEVEAAPRKEAADPAVVAGAGEGAEEKAPGSPASKPSSPQKAGSKQKATKKAATPSEDADQRLVNLRLTISMETKYDMQSLINDMKLNGYADRLTMKDFVVAAIEEKIKRDRKRFGLD
jgi:hypothetical protein